MSLPGKLVLVAGVALAAFFTGSWYRGRGPDRASAAPGGRKILYWHDPMHPAYKSDKPGIAPDCGMKLEPVYADGGPADPVPSSVPGAVTVSPERQQVIGMRLGRAETLTPNQTMRLSGRVAVDETRIYRLFAVVEGWVRIISPDTTGNIVQKDELLATYFSRDLLTPQQAYIYALDTRDRAAAPKRENSADQVRLIDAQVQNAQDNLITLGMTEYQVREVARNRKASSIMQVRAPATGIILLRNVTQGLRIERNAELYRIADLSRVWVLADLFEREQKLVPLGSRAKVTYLDRAMPAIVSKALPQFDPATRTLKLRLELDNPGYVLRPDMFVDVELPVRLPAAVTVPADAIIDSGLRKVVYVDRGNGLFEPREVETGWRFGDRVAISRGLQPGEHIVTSGTFLIDSESRMKLTALGSRPVAEKKKGADPDPVCGMEVDPARGLETEYHGKTYRFCSEGCKRKFDQNPSKYATTGGNKG